MKLIRCNEVVVLEKHVLGFANENKITEYVGSIIQNEIFCERE